MTLVNIPRSREDPNYRYKMPKLISKIEGRGNGIKTNIPNIAELSRSLKRPPMYVTKFFGCELGAMVQYFDTEKYAHINGAHKEPDLIKILDKFIEMYVLCQNCQLPEMDMLVKREQIFGKCNACGFQSQLDSTHKASTYMIRNPPNQDTSTMGKKKSDKKSTHKSTAAPTTSNSTTPSNSTSPPLTKQKSDGDSKKIKPKRSSEKKLRKSSTDADDVNGENKSDGQEVAKSKKSQSKKNSTKSLLNDELDYESPDIEESIERLKSSIGQTNITDLDQFFHELRMLQVSRNFDSKCKIFIVFRVVFDKHISRELLSAQAPIIKKAKDRSIKPDDILDAVQYFCHKYSSHTLSDYPYILKALYDEFILDADDIIDFYLPEKDDAIHTECRTIIQPLLTWLDEDEEIMENEVNGDLNGSHDDTHNNFEQCRDHQTTHTDTNVNTEIESTHNHDVKNGATSNNQTHKHTNKCDVKHATSPNTNNNHTLTNGATLCKITHSDSFSSLVSKYSESGERTEFHDAEDGSLSSSEDM